MTYRAAGAAALAIFIAACTAESRTPETALAAVDPVSVAMADGKLAEGPYAPMDECADLPGFVSFRGSLNAAIENRDSDAMVALSHPALKLDFGGGAGIDEFRRRLDADDTLWDALDDLVFLGCASDRRDHAAMPWSFERAPETDDPFETYYVIGNDVPLRAKATEKSEKSGSLSHDFVMPVGGEAKPTDGFVEVRSLSNASTGYVAEASLRSLVDYRLIVDRSDRGWEITAFVAGD